MFRPLLGLAFALVTATSALAQTGPAVPAKSLQYAQPTNIVFIPSAIAPAGTKDGDKLNLVDPDDKKVTGTGTVRRKLDNGSWEVTVDTVKR